MPAAPWHPDVTDEHVTFPDVAFVDDCTFPIEAETPGALDQRVSTAICIIGEEFASRGIALNWKPSKTAAVLMLRGRGARAAAS
eukprot:4690046-Lingulodinium_polyedra.AAC.1